ncbi:cytochrome c oxidase subunit 4 [Enemella evansiae]|uniref:Cytochrome c oxidase polypeptide 4 n=1 Tax=Enemella evansiae TaxID=2016499 RepID=A0A255GJ34_9ACTN|nr:cytochrome c oxidase subunit 4 [Enemella evansiae]PFG68003.1 cytochrome c oxidase subunit IV [Propionibacteriaceae bacterium ES.041]OYN95797.1 cytochrome C oxidase subunit IV [Enemella evansiae]OYO01571.1 cytochrome C oxidase subunit IV [Enemella evansiae]OYO04007.1 cytochrome C oxidase subunit IV [Enemella evansiae]OYO08317.1 cytochrome C oxidase subunit IV [Enemella evansiae]
MRTEYKIFIPLGLFFVVCTVAYYFFGRVDGGQLEWVGLAALALTSLMVLQIGVFLWVTARKMDPRPEDRSDGDVVEGAGDIGFFPPRSLWPFIAAVTAGLVFLGPVFGWWLTALGVGFGALAVAGWVYEYYRGDYSH